ncbi:MAG: hypothetical protein H0U66_06795 [Gemmatimonadaceae bacterium]|nr:hypothetical protein [Gemmatimonadaceae bacterium]
MKNGLVVLVVLAGALAGCSKNADGDMVIQTPRMETHTDTVKMPRLEMSKDTIVTITPTVVVKKETSVVVVPHASVTTAPKSKP